MLVVRLLSLRVLVCIRLTIILHIPHRLCRLSPADLFQPFVLTAVFRHASHFRILALFYGVESESKKADLTGWV